ncbi:F-box domain-containing protein [Mycena venus]|uniref:F-box domain-containing protein n=1 Tax=Mycena venus TaxID=2733690 RepID=A0A8H6XAC6_9AGAR|nr:F-box domain-containing protein [Mycena venus]
MASPDSRRRRIAEIDEEIARLQAERQALADCLTFPVVTLPVEIVSQIFMYCLPDDPLAPGAFDPAVVLGQVCRLWRDIALSLPDLWSSWSLAVDGNIPFGRVVMGINLWMSRSQNRPLSIRLHHRDGAGNDVSYADECWWELVSDFEREVMPSIVPHHRRWKKLELNDPLTHLRDLAKVIPTDGLPHLTHLLLGSVQLDWGANNPDEDEPVTLFADAPQLQNLHLVLEEDGGLERFDHVELPYGQLTSFTGTSFGSCESLTLLDKAPSLVDCVFYIGSTEHMGIPISSDLPHLQSLKLFTTGPKVDLAIVLENLTLPALETLVLGRHQGRVENDLASLLLRSECAIQHFSCQSMDSDELVDCLEYMPTLMTLDLFDYDQREVVEVIRHLDFNLDKHGVELISNLQTIAIQCQKWDKGHEAEFSYNALIALLQAMSKRRTPLRHFRLVWTSSLLPRKPNAREVGNLKDLTKGGMNIYVGTPERSWI